MNDYTSIADLYDLYVTDTRDHALWTRRVEEAPGAILETHRRNGSSRGGRVPRLRRSVL
jgi:hypothetical protein